MASTDWKRDLVHYAAAYLLWLITVALALFAGAVARDCYMLLLAVSEANRYLARATHNFLIILLAMLILGLIVFVEHHYRTAVPKGSLGARFFRMAAILLGVIAGLHTIRLAMLLTLGPATPLDVVITGAEWLATVLFVWLHRRFRSPTRR
jgi:hypothetical protein